MLATSKPLFAIFHRDRVDAEETVAQKQSQVTPDVADQAVGVVHVVLLFQVVGPGQVDQAQVNQRVICRCAAFVVANHCKLTHRTAGHTT